MSKYFGTDGIRGIVNKDLTPELAMEVGKAAAYILNENNKKGTVLIGRDTRISGEMLMFALTSGLISKGIDVVDLGIATTPMVSYLTKKHKALAGIMISASHNPSEYNGIKIFNNNGFKLSDELEAKIEKYIFNKKTPDYEGKIGVYKKQEDLKNEYIDYLLGTVSKIDKMKVVIDCANGSASEIASILFNQTNLDAIIINKDYDGYNINKNCGSLYLDKLSKEVVKNKADLGFAYDGDADRCLFVDSDGKVINGDFVLAIVTQYLKNNKKLKNNTLVGTVMSNFGLKKYCEENNVYFITTKVGDRCVLEKMLEGNYIIGGETSGHIIFKEHSNTGDGILTSLQILDILTKTKTSLKEAALIMKEYPQVLINVKISKEGKELCSKDKDINKMINECEKQISSNGRILVRPSGTENLIRVMVEGINAKQTKELAERIAKEITRKYKL